MLYILWNFPRNQITLSTKMWLLSSEFLLITLGNKNNMATAGIHRPKIGIIQCWAWLHDCLLLTVLMFWQCACIARQLACVSITSTAQQQHCFLGEALCLLLHVKLEGHSPLQFRRGGKLPGQLRTRLIPALSSDKLFFNWWTDGWNQMKANKVSSRGHNIVVNDNQHGNQWCPFGKRSK